MRVPGGGFTESVERRPYPDLEAPAQLTGPVPHPVGDGVRDRAGPPMPRPDR
ncbi:hypothetical protein J3S85_21440 [Streptomyces lavenduligriseus]|nr:hypothetical protein J3S85_21440 [Streptomyces lavenduligriseus]